MPATAACRQDENLMGIAVDTDGIGFFDALCSEVPAVAAISAEESLCYLAGVALAEVPLSPDRCMAVDELIARRTRLENYGDKARFALADSYDRATQTQARREEE